MGKLEEAVYSLVIAAEAVSDSTYDEWAGECKTSLRLIAKLRRETEKVLRVMDEETRRNGHSKPVVVGGGSSEGASPNAS